MQFLNCTQRFLRYIGAWHVAVLMSAGMYAVCERSLLRSFKLNEARTTSRVNNIFTIIVAFVFRRASDIAHFEHS